MTITQVCKDYFQMPQNCADSMQAPPYSPSHLDTTPCLSEPQQHSKPPSDNPPASTPNSTSHYHANSWHHQGKPAVSTHISPYPPHYSSTAINFPIASSSLRRTSSHYIVYPVDKISKLQTGQSNVGAPQLCCNLELHVIRRQVLTRTRHGMSPSRCTSATSQARRSRMVKEAK